MSLYIILKSTNPVTSKPNELERHVPFHNGSLPTLTNEEINFIQADGDELEYIQKMFTNIPMIQRRVVRWYGDMAKFIYYNLC